MFDLSLFQRLLVAAFLSGVIGAITVWAMKG